MNEQPASLPNGFRDSTGEALLRPDPSPLPEDWQVVRLREVARVDWGNTSLTKSIYTSSGYPVFSASGQDGYSDFYEHEGKAVILSAIGARCGKCFFASGRWTAIKNTIIIKTYENTANPLFLYYLLNEESKWPRSGSGQPFISIGKAKAVVIPLPPLPEQRAIAHVLTSIQRAIEATEQVIAAARELKKSLMRHLFTYGPVSPAEAESVPLQETEIGPLPVHWRVVRLGEVAQIEMGQSPPSITYNSEGIGLPFFQGKADFGDIYPTTRKWCSSPNKIAEKDDILLSVRAPIGDVNIATQRCCIGRGLTAIRAGAKSDSKYLFYHLLFSQELLESKGTGTTFKQINKETVTHFLIPLPPLPEQRAIAEMLGAVDEKIQAEENRKTALQSLFRSMLHHLMTGKVRVAGLVTPPTQPEE